MSGFPRTNQHGPSRDVNQGRSISFRRGEEMFERGREMLSYDGEPFDVTEGDIGDPCGITVTITSSDTRPFRDGDKKPMSERLGRKPGDDSETMSKSPKHKISRKRSRSSDKGGDKSETKKKRNHHSRGRKRSRSSEKSDGGHKGKSGKRKRHESSKRRDGRGENKQADYIADLEPVTPDAEDHDTFMFDQRVPRDDINYKETESRNHFNRESHTRSSFHFERTLKKKNFERRSQQTSSSYDMKFDRVNRYLNNSAHMSNQNDYSPRYLRERPPLPEIHDYNRVNRDVYPRRQYNNRSDFPGDIAGREAFKRDSNDYDTEEGVPSDLPTANQRDGRKPNQRSDKYTDRETGYQQTVSMIPSNDVSSSRRELDQENHHHYNDEHRDHRIGLEPLEINPNQSLEEQLECSEFEEDVVAEIMRIVATQKSKTTTVELLKLVQRVAGIPFATLNQLTLFLQNHKSHFELINEFNGRCIIVPKADIQVCQAYVSKASTCGSSCDDLHICKFQLFGTCTKQGKCNLEHDLYSEHNISALIRARLHRTPPEDINRVVSLPKNRNSTTLPVVCKFYNNPKTCNKDACPHLHICKHVVENNCMFGRSCIRNHTLDTPDCTRVLRRFALLFRNMTEEHILLNLLRNNRPSSRLPSSRYFEPKPSKPKNIVKAPLKARAREILEAMKLVEKKIKKKKLKEEIKKKENMDIDGEISSARSPDQTMPSRSDTSLKLQMHDASHTAPCADETMPQNCSPASPNDATKSPSSSPMSVTNTNATLNYTPTSHCDTPTPLNTDSTSTPYAALSSPTRCAETSLITFGDLAQNVAPPSDAIVQPRSPIETQSSKMITPNLPDRETANAKTEEQDHHDQSAEAENEDPNITTEPLIKVDMQTNKEHTADQGSLQALQVTRPIKLEVDKHDAEHPNLAPDHGCTADSSQYEQIPRIKLENDQELSYDPVGSLEVPDKHDRGTIVPDSVSMDVSDTPGIIDGSINIMKHATVDEQNTVDPADDHVVVSMTKIEIIESSSQSPVSETLANIETTNNENNASQRDSQVETENTDCEHSSCQVLTKAERQSTTNDKNDFENTKLEEKNVPLDAESMDDLKTSKEQGCTGGEMIAMPEEKDQTPFSGSDLTSHGSEDSRDDPDDTSLVVDLKLRVNDVDSLHIRSHHSGRWDISSGHVSGTIIAGNAEVCDVIKQACLRLVEASQRLRNTCAEHETDGGDKESSTTE